MAVKKPFLRQGNGEKAEASQTTRTGLKISVVMNPDLTFVV